MRTKLQKLLNKLDGKNEATAKVVADFDAGVKALRDKLEQDISVTTLQEVNVKINNLRKSINIQPLISQVEDLHILFKNNTLEVIKESEDNYKKIESEISNIEESIESKIYPIFLNNENLKKDFDNFVKVNSASIVEFGKNLSSINSKLSEFVDKKQIFKLLEEKESKIKSLDEKYKDYTDKVRIELLNKLANKGGGSMNQKISINGTVMSGKYADFNLTGTGITATDNNTTKQVDISLSGLVGGSSLADVSADSTTTPNSVYQMTATIPVEFRRSDGSTLLYLDETNSRIGIGTATPNTILHLHRATTTTTVRVQLTDGTSGSGAADGVVLEKDSTGDAYFWNYENKNMQFGTNNTLALTLNTSQQGIFTSGTSSVPAIGFAGQTTTGFSYGGVSSQINIVTAGQSPMNFTRSGTAGRFNGSGGQYLEYPTTGDISLVASGTNQNITLTPSGTGFIFNQNDSFTGIVSQRSSSGTGGRAVRLINGANNSWYLAALGSGDTPGNALSFRYNDSTIPGTRLAVTTTGNLLIGGLTTDGTGVLQFPAATTSAGGITFGTDVNLYRSASNTLAIGGTSAILNVLGTTASSSITTGALTVAGGVGVTAAFFGRNINISYASADSALIVRSQGDGTNEVKMPVSFFEYGDTATVGLTLGLNRARGTIASPSAVLADDVLGGLYGRGYHSGPAWGTNNVAVIRLLAAENFTSSAQGSYIDFATTAIGAISRTTRMTLSAAGNLGIGASPTYKLDVQGTSGTVAIRAASSTADDILYYATGTVTGTLNVFATATSATLKVLSSITNQNSTSNTADARYQAIVSGANAGDPIINFTISGLQDWAVGVDNSDSDKFKIGANSSFGSNEWLTITTAGVTNILASTASTSIASGSLINAGGFGNAGAIFGGTTISAGTYFLRSVGNALTATGTTRTDALQLAKEVNNLTTVAAGTGVILPVGVVGMRIVIFNNGANPVQVYASASETIDTVAGSTGVPLTNAKRCEYFYTVANTWLSAQMGVVSA